MVWSCRGLDKRREWVLMCSTIDAQQGNAGVGWSQLGPHWAIALYRNNFGLAMLRHISQCESRCGVDFSTAHF